MKRQPAKVRWQIVRAIRRIRFSAERLGRLRRAAWSALSALLATSRRDVLSLNNQLVFAAEVVVECLSCRASSFRDGVNARCLKAVAIKEFASCVN